MATMLLFGREKRKNRFVLYFVIINEKYLLGTDRNITYQLIAPTTGNETID